MAYFSNGTEGMGYEEDWCNRCLHQETCPVWLAHLMHNYEECNNENSILHLLIPRTPDGLRNERCLTFVDKGLLSGLALQKYEHDQAQAVREINERHKQEPAS